MLAPAQASIYTVPRKLQSPRAHHTGTLTQLWHNGAAAAAQAALHQLNLQAAVGEDLAQLAGVHLPCIRARHLDLRRTEAGGTRWGRQLGQALQWILC